MNIDLLKVHKALYDKAFLLGLDSREKKPVFKPGIPLFITFRNDVKHITDGSCNYIVLPKEIILSTEIIKIDSRFEDLLIVCSEGNLEHRLLNYSVLLVTVNKLRLLQAPQGVNFSCDFSDGMLYLIHRFYYDLIEQNLTFADLVANQHKARYFGKKRNHPVMSVNGSKLGSYLYLNKHNIKVPQLLAGQNNGEKLEKDFSTFLSENPERFVLKAERGCSSMGVHILEKDGESYNDLLNNKTFLNSELIELSENYENFIVEEKLGHEGIIPIDVKCYSFDGKPKYLMIFDRNFKESHGSVFVLGYNLEKKIFEHKPFLNFQQRFKSPEDSSVKDQMCARFNDIGEEKIIHFVTVMLRKIECNDFLSVDVFSHSNELYVGEVTRTPGAFLYHIMSKENVNHIFNHKIGQLIKKD